MIERKTEFCFIDSNIWLYAFIEWQDPTKSARAILLIEEISPVVSTQVINEVCLNLLKKANFSEDQVAMLIESFYEKYPVIELNRLILSKASELRRHYAFSFWDSMIISSGLWSGAAILYSEDMQDGLEIEQRLQIRNPFTA